MPGWQERDPNTNIASLAELMDILRQVQAPGATVERFRNRYQTIVARGGNMTLKELQQELWTNYQNVWSQGGQHDNFGKAVTTMFPSGLLSPGERTATIAAAGVIGGVAGGAVGGVGGALAGAAVLPTALGMTGLGVDPAVKAEVAAGNQPAKPPVVPTRSNPTPTTTIPGGWEPRKFGDAAPMTWDQGELANLYRLGAGVPELQSLVAQLTTDPRRPDLTNTQGQTTPLIGWERGMVDVPVPSNTSPALVERMERTGERPTLDQTTRSPGLRRLSLKEVMNWPYSLKPDEWRKVQEHLIAAGMVDPEAVRKKQIAFGNPRDAQTMGAWVDLIRQSLAQPDKTMWELLEENKSTLPEGYLNALQGSSPIRLSDPATIREQTRKLDESLLGRRGDVNRYVDLVHRSETSLGSQLQADDGRTITDVDVEARIREAIMAENPAEYEAHELASQFAMFQQMIAGSPYTVR